VFGDYISVYDIARAAEDGATVPIYYESRLAKLALSETERPKIDPTFEEVTEGEEIERKEKLKSKWAQIEALVGTEKRVALIAQDFVQHFEQRLAAMDGKAMIVCMSRRICVDFYNAIVKLRPDWHSEDDAAGAIKVVMTGDASDTHWQAHIRTKKRRERLADRFRDPASSFRVVIVRDMWGLVVDYLGLADELRKATAIYTESGGTGQATHDPAEAVAGRSSLGRWPRLR
jgi:type I restriction enzyme, R subunit